MEQNKQVTRWCFTINNWTEDDLPVLGTHWKYLIYGKEVGENGTPHLQGFGILHKRLRLSQVAKLLPRAHLSATRMTTMAAAEYCKKEGDYVELGSKPEPSGSKGGEATKRKWDLIKENAKTGNFDAIDSQELVRYYHSIKRIRQDYMKAPPDLDSVCGLWITGPPGVGKSHKARADHPGYYDKPCNKWWDGYQGEKYVIIDDFDKAHAVLGHHLKRWADRYAFPAEHKGTTVQIRPEKIVVTSNYTIEELFCEDKTLTEALLRRFEVLEITEADF